MAFSGGQGITKYSVGFFIVMTILLIFLLKFSGISWSSALGHTLSTTKPIRSFMTSLPKRLLGLTNNAWQCLPSLSGATQSIKNTLPSMPSYFKSKKNPSPVSTPPPPSAPHVLACTSSVSAATTTTHTHCVFPQNAIRPASLHSSTFACHPSHQWANCTIECSSNVAGDVRSCHHRYAVLPSSLAPPLVVASSSSSTPMDSVAYTHGWYYGGKYCSANCVKKSIGTFVFGECECWVTPNPDLEHLLP